MARFVLFFVVDRPTPGRTLETTDTP